MTDQKLFNEEPEEQKPTVEVEAKPDHPDVMRIGSAEIVPAPVMPMAKMTSVDAIEEKRHQAEQRILAEQALKKAALTFTNHYDWVMQRSESGEDRPYLQTTGAEKLIHAFGVELEVTSQEVVNRDDSTYEVVVIGKARAQVYDDIWYPVTGSRWSGDGFFSKGGKVRIDPGDVRKAALTNFYNRAIKTVLGMRNLTMEDLEKCPSIDVSKIGRITYQETGAGGGGASVTGILAEKHIAVAVPYKDETNRSRLKKGTTCRFHREEHPTVGKGNLWLVAYTPEAEQLVADLKADNGEIEFWVVEASNED